MPKTSPQLVLSAAASVLAMAALALSTPSDAGRPGAGSAAFAPVAGLEPPSLPSLLR